MARTDPQLKALIDKVGSKKGTEEETKQLDRIVDRIAKDLSSSGEAVKATVMNQSKPVSSNSKEASASRPPLVAVPSVNGAKKGHGTGLKSPVSSKPPTPQLTKATIPPSVVPSPLVTAGPTPDTSVVSSRTTSPTEASASSSVPTTSISPPKPATSVKAEGAVATTSTTATTKTMTPTSGDEKFQVTIGKGSWNVVMKEHMEDDLLVRLIASNQTKIASTAPGKEHDYCPYKFDIDPQDFASVVAENCHTNTKTTVTMIFREGRGGGRDKHVVLTFDRFDNPDSKAVESGRVQARRFCRWLKLVNMSIRYTNKRLV